MSVTLPHLTLKPRGNVEITKDYGNNTVEFENGSKQFQRRWITPRVSFSFDVQGDATMKTYLENFVTQVHGNYSKFTWTYEGTTYTVRFADKSVTWTEIRGYEGVGTIGYNAKITLEVVKGSE